MSSPASPKLSLILGVHNHQPVGNFDHVFRESVARCYRPLTEAIASHPDITWNIHFSGPLLLWLRTHEKGLVSLLRQMVSRGQVEILGSGVSEPILYSLPPRDVATQIEAMQDLIGELFDVSARGLWLTERIWEPSLPSLLKPLGIEYVLVDDFHFFYAGLPKGHLDGYYAVEKYGEVMKVFPISEALRYRIPFKAVPEFMPELRKWRDDAVAAGKNGLTLTYVDDGEKFGVWPGTYEWVYEKGWLHAFMNELAANRDWVETCGLGEVADRQSATARAALPTASYREMMQWALPVAAGRQQDALAHELGEARHPQLRGGFWDMFLVKYEESNRIHKRMLFTSDRLHQIDRSLGRDATPQQQTALAHARHALHLAQCNDALWHGLFGGLYLPFLRAALYEQVMIADDILTRAGMEEPSFIRRQDFNRNGEDDVVVRSPGQTLVVSPADGGCLYLWDDHGMRHSLTDVLTRREEGYHDKVRKLAEAPAEGESDAPASIHDLVLSKESGLEKHLVYDRWLRLPGRAFITAARPDAESLRANDFQPQGDMATARFAIHHAETVEGVHRIVLTNPSVSVGSANAAIVKTYLASEQGPGWALSCSFGNVPASAVKGAWFCLELNLTLNADDPFRSIRNDAGDCIGLRGQVDWTGVRQVQIVDDYRHVCFDFVPGAPTDVAIYPIETVSVSESGFERNYQGVCITMLTPLAQAASDGFSLTVGRTRLGEKG